MDYVTRQFVLLTKMLRHEIRKALESAHNSLENLTNSVKNLKDSIDAQHQSDNEYRERQIITVAELRTQEPIRIQNEPDQSKPRIIWRRAKGFLEVMGILAVIVYTMLANKQWHEMISARHQQQIAVEAAQISTNIARQSLEAVQRPFVVFKAAPDMNGVTYNFQSLGWRIQMPMENTGNTPAIDLKDQISWTSHDGLLPVSYKYPDLSPPYGTSKIITGHPISPHEIAFSPPIIVPHTEIRKWIDSQQPGGFDGAFMNRGECRSTSMAGLPTETYSTKVLSI